MPKLALFDMDGTLFDHDGQLRSDLEKLRAPEEKIDFDMLFFGDLRKLSDEHPHIKSRIDLIRNQPGWWLRLPSLGCKPPGLLESPALDWSHRR